MALRVLLADESSTIKKVIQLALQDFAVEVKSVPVGIDVVQVAYEFKPDIVFADVLLAKKSGYDVSSEIKNDSRLHTLPVILMWSSFMELDQSRFHECGADDKLEKPFDADSLVSLVKKLVPKLRENKIVDFIGADESAINDDKTPVHLISETHTKTNFPPPPEETLEAHESFDSKTGGTLSAQNNFEDSLDGNSVEDFLSAEIETIDNPDFIGSDFVAAPLPSTNYLQDAPTGHDDDEMDSWTQKDLSQFKLKVDPSLASADEISGLSDEMDLAKKYHIPTGEITQSKGPSEKRSSGQTDIYSIDSGEFEEITSTSPLVESLRDRIANTTANAAASATSAAVNINNKTNNPSGISAALTENQIQEMVKNELRPIIENIVWKIAPDIAERIIREEIARLMRETEKSVY